MNSKSKVLLAVLAVAIMLGTALVPLTVDNTDSLTSAAKDTEKDSSNSFSILDTLNELKEGSLDKLKSMGFILANPGAFTTTSELSENISTETTVPAKTMVTLKNDGNYVFTGTGKVIIDKGAAIELFQFTKSTNVTITDNIGNKDVKDQLFVLKPGAYIAVFGLYLQFVGKYDTTGDVLYELLSMTYTGSETAAPSDTLKCKLYFRGGMSGSLTMDIENADNNVTILDSLNILGRDEYKSYDHVHDFEFYGEFENLNDSIYIDGKVTSELLLEKRIELGYTYDEYLVADFSIKNTRLVCKFTGDNVTGIAQLGINVSGDQSIRTECRNNHNPYGEQERIVEIHERIKDANFSTGDFEFSMDVTKGSAKTNAVVTVSLPKDIIIHIGSLHSDTVEVLWKCIGHDITNFDVVLSTREIAISMEYDNVGKMNHNIHTDLSISLSTDIISAGPKNNVQKGLSNYVYFKETRVNISSISLDFNNGKIGLAAGEITFFGIFDGTYLCMFMTTINASILNFSHTEYADRIVDKCDLDVKSKYVENGIDKKIDLSSSNLVIVKSDDGTTVTSDKLILDANLSMDVVPQVLSLLGIDMNIQKLVPGHSYIEINDMAIVNPNILDLEFDELSATSLSILFENNVSYEKKSYVLDGNVKIVTDDGDPSNFTFECDTFNGIAKIAGKEEQEFSITNHPKVKQENDGAIINKFGLVPKLEILNGNASFGAAFIMADIIVSNGVGFSANGLTAHSIQFEDGCKPTGFITLDSAYVVQYEGQYIPGYVAFGDSYMFKLVSGTSAAAQPYALTYDLSKRSGGEIWAHAGYNLPTKLDGTGFAVRSDGVKGTYTISSSTGCTFDPKCIKISYTVTFADGSMPSKQYAYGDTITYPDTVPSKSGCRFIGWTDGSGTIYYDEKNKATPWMWMAGDESFTYYNGKMPARDIVLTPLFAKIVDSIAIEEDGKIIMVADAHDYNVIEIPVITNDFDTLRIYLEGTFIEMDETTYRLVNNRLTGDKSCPMFVFSFKLDAISEGSLKDVVGDNTAYHVLFRNLYQNYYFMSCSTNGGSGILNVHMTFDVKANDNVDHFISKGINRNGIARENAFESMELTSDGIYKVKVNAQYFQQSYSVISLEPVYKQPEPEPEPSHNDNSWIFVLLAVILALIIVFIMVLYARRQQE